MKPLAHFVSNLHADSDLKLQSRSHAEMDSFAASSQCRGLSGKVPIKVRRHNGKNGIQRRLGATESTGERLEGAQALGKLYVPRGDARRRAGGIKGRDDKEQLGRERHRWSFSDLPDRFSRNPDGQIPAKHDANKRGKPRAVARRSTSNVDVRQDGLSRPLQFRKFVHKEHSWVQNFAR